MFASYTTFLTSALFKYGMIALIVAGIMFKIYGAGEQHVQAKWDADKIAVKAEIDRLKAEAGKVTTVVETKYVDRVKTITVKGDTITEYVDHYITQSEDKACTIPNNFILLHDLAVKNITLPEVAK
jgi:hypothetical protein